MTPIILLCGKSRVGKDTVGQMIADLTGAQCIALADPIKRFLSRAYGLSEVQLWGDAKEMKFVPIRPGEGTLVAAFKWAAQFDVDLEPNLQEAIAAWAEEVPSVTTAREMMQTFGTECIRAEDPDFWINTGHSIADVLLLDADLRYQRAIGLVEVTDSKEKSAPAPVVVITDGRLRNEIFETNKINGRCVRVLRANGENDLRQWKNHRSEVELEAIPNAWFSDVLPNDGKLEDLEFRVLNLCLKWGLEPKVRQASPLK